MTIVPNSITVYHITHIDNLPQIIGSGGLWCDSERLRQGWESVNIAHKALKERRMRTRIPVSAGGVLGDYVPFYFCSRSPMLFSIHTGHVDGFNGGQSSVLYLATSVGRIISGDRQWVFTDGHAAERVTLFYDALDNLDQLDWNLIRSWSWGNTTSDIDRKRRKQAEFLVKESFPWEWVENVVVIDSKVKSVVKSILNMAEYKPPVSVNRSFYYD